MSQGEPQVGMYQKQKSRKTKQHAPTSKTGPPLYFFCRSFLQHVKLTRRQNVGVKRNQRISMMCNGGQTDEAENRSGCVTCWTKST